MTEKTSALVARKEGSVAVQENTANQLLSVAIEKGLPVESLEKLLTMYEKIEDRKARNAFNEAMTDFQGECPIIEKKKEGGKTNSGQVAYKYASLAMITKVTAPIMRQFGLSYKFDVEIANGRVKVTCIAKHEMGHSESSSMDISFATKTGVMSNPQQEAATVTFAKRYALINAFGITTGDEDIDAKAPAQITSEEIDQIEMEMQTCETQDELKNVWNKYYSRLIKTMTKDEFAEFNKIKDQIKSKLK